MSDPLPLGIHFGIHDEVYRADPGVAQSSLKYARTSMNHVRCSIDGEMRPRKSKATEIGTAIHLRVMQPDEFRKRIVLAPDGYDGRTKEGKAWAAANVADGQDILNYEDGKRVTGMYDRLMDHPVFRAAVEQCNFEVTLIHMANTPKGEIRIKGRPDIVPHEGRCICDLKKTTLGTAHQDVWGKDIAKWGYHIQAAYYLDLFNAVTGSERTAFIHFAVEEDPPHEIGCYQIDDEAVSIGRMFYQDALLRYAECVQTGVWPGYSETPIKISLPPWAKQM